MRAGGEMETSHKVETKGLQAKVAFKLANLESESPCSMERNTGNLSTVPPKKQLTVMTLKPQKYPTDFVPSAHRD